MTDVAKIGFVCGSSRARFAGIVDHGKRCGCPSARIVRQVARRPELAFFDFDDPTQP